MENTMKMYVTAEEVAELLGVYRNCGDAACKVAKSIDVALLRS